MSKTPYFENNNLPNKELDKAVFDELKAKSLDL